MILKLLSALVLIAAAAVPALAQVKSGDAMTSGEAMTAPMKPMTATEKALLARCAKMSRRLRSRTQDVPRYLRCSLQRPCNWSDTGSLH